MQGVPRRDLPDLHLHPCPRLAGSVALSKVVSSNLGFSICEPGRSLSS